MLTMIITALITAILLGFCIGPVNGRRRRKRAVGFFHPYTNDGGGEETVLWCAVRGIQEESLDLDCYVNTGDHDATPQSLMARAIDRFGVTLLSPPKVVFVQEEVDRRNHLSTLYNDWSKSGFYVSRMGGLVQVYPFLLL